MARSRSCDQHPPLPVPKLKPKPAPTPHDPRNRMLFSPSGSFLGFAAPATSPASAEQIVHEKESQQ
jgi:hypothetical protein